MLCHFDTVEAIKAVNSLKVLSDSKSYPIDLAIGDGRITMANPDDKGQAIVTADTDGQGFVRLDGQYLADVLKACGGMVEFSLASASSPVLFSQDGYRVVVMPMITEKAQAEAKEAKAEAARKIADLPQYIGQRLVRLICDIERIDNVRSSIEAVRQSIPGEAIEVEQERIRNGSQQSLI